MASKPQGRNYVKDKYSKQNAKTPQNELPDEIALRDEIFQLKRQIMLLKKANEKNIIKVRKYEDEAKKKDRQIEQLMDPVKNGDVRKLLSTKGAALLLNLKEQNNTLIQMILDKDTQIRKLLSEIKTSKLYVNTRRMESYRNETEKLRNLLIKSQNMMKEAQDIPLRRSICVGGAPAMEITLSSDQSSPRDLEELQFTIQSLEMHMKYSNELLARKNEQIIQLTDQLQSYQCNTCRRNIKTKYIGTLVKPSEYDFQKSTMFEKDSEGTSEESDAIRATPVNPAEISSPKLLELFEKNVVQPRERIEQKRLSNSAPAGPVKSYQDFSYISKRDSTPYYAGSSDNVKHNAREGSYLDVPARDEGREARMPGNDFLAKNQDHLDSTPHYRLTPNVKTELDNQHVPDRSDFIDLEKAKRKNFRILSVVEDDSDIETAEFEMMERKIENDQIEIESSVKLTPRPDVECGDQFCEARCVSPSPEPKNEIVDSRQNEIVLDETVTASADEDETDERSSENDWEPDDGVDRESPPNELSSSEKALQEQVNDESEGDQYERETSSMHEHEIIPEPQNADKHKENEINRKSIVDSYQASVDSSYDSQSSASIMHEVEVEAEINHSSIIEDYALTDVDKTNADENDNDDDDVVIG